MCFFWVINIYQAKKLDHFVRIYIDIFCFSGAENKLKLYEGLETGIRMLVQTQTFNLFICLYISVIFALCIYFFLILLTHIYLTHFLFLFPISDSPYISSLILLLVLPLPLLQISFHCLRVQVADMGVPVPFIIIIN